MRKIKFRAWDGERLKPVTVWGFSEGFIMTSKYSADEGEFKVMQYTGLKDKNGREIYEGDLVDTDDGIAEVKYDNRFALFMMDCEFHRITFFNYLIGQHDQFEVIGNIYENPELKKSIENDQ